MDNVHKSIASIWSLQNSNNKVKGNFELDPETTKFV